jgi:hypothetical protein
MGLLVPAPIAKDEAERIVHDKLRWILGSSDPLAVIVFGSAARDEMTERSAFDHPAQQTSCSNGGHSCRPSATRQR